MGKIHVLDKHVAELIAAGEVVERPSSVVKELVENSIDAGSNFVTVEIQHGGVTFLRVTDNGCGIAREDVQNAFLRHATSKVFREEDLDGIATLGFRGEALASISAVAHVELLTRTADELAGTRFTISGGEKGELSDAGCAVGTTIVVRDLFYNTPARMKFLKKDVSESNAVAAVLDRAALSHPEISFRFIKDGKEELNTPGDGNLKNCIFAVYGKEFTSGMLPVSYEMNGVKVSGFISKPASARPNRSMQHFFLNGRYVKSRTAMVALEEGFKGSVMVGKFPSCVLHLYISPECVDVNVHPAKIEVRFFNERPIFDAVYHGVKSTLAGGDRRAEMKLSPLANQFAAKKESVKQINFTEYKSTELLKIPEEKPEAASSEPPDSQNEENVQASFLPRKESSGEKGINPFPLNAKEEPLVSLPPKIPFDRLRLHDFAEETNYGYLSALDYRRDDPLSREKSEKELLSDLQPSLKEDSEVISPVLLSKEKKAEETIAQQPEKGADTSQKFPEKAEQENFFREAVISGGEQIRVIGEAFQTYLLLENCDELLLIDKHAAHERLLYERLKAEKGKSSAQCLLEPVTVTLEKNDYTALLEQLPLLDEAGFEIEDFGGGTVLVRSAPLSFERADVASSVIEIAGHFAQNRRDVSTEELDWLYHNIACRAAIKAGKPSSEKELIALVKMLIEHPEVRYCPHGRPVYVALTRKELEKQFKRI